MEWAAGAEEPHYEAGMVLKTRMNRTRSIVLGVFNSAEVCVWRDGLTSAANGRPAVRNFTVSL